MKILHEYVDNMNFTDMVFDEAIRKFLSGFRLPGEAQKIDRIMEKFAERYTTQNPTVFPSADTAFILAFSIIMLNTDLHNPSIAENRRMTLEGFIKNNRGISIDGSDLPKDMLEGIFLRIQKSAFSLKEDDDARQQVVGGKEGGGGFDGFFSSSKEEKKRREEFQRERDELEKKSSLLLQKAKNNGGGLGGTAKGNANDERENEMLTLTPSEAVPFMFDVAWGAAIGSMSQILEFTEDPKCIALCLRGFVYAVRVASFNGMNVARDTFVNSLAKFTTLGSIKEIKEKNIECIRALLSIAISDGDTLFESWAPVLQCISQLAKLQLHASGLATDDELFEVDDGERERRGSFDPGFTRLSSSKFGGKEKKEKKNLAAARQMELDNGRAVLEAFNDDLIDKVFANSVKLSVDGITHFITELIQVSANEVVGDGGKTFVSGGGMTSPEFKQMNGDGYGGGGGSGARIFALQRLVEVADFNMNVRPRIVWTQIWGMMARHFAVVGCHENSMVSMYAIDSLRQLSFKFLEKPELKDFNFQRIFLKPFVVIMESHSSREDVRELILRCVDNMIRALAKNIRSGWRTIFSILTLSAGDSSLVIAKLGLEILHRLLDECLVQLCSSVEDFLALVKTSLR